MDGERKRLYESILREHLGHHRQMCFVSGPRQVGKTTTCRGLADHYLDWDHQDHRKIILEGPQAVARSCGLENLPVGAPPVLVFDELHKFARWKNFLKGFFDVHGDRCRILVTGSARLDIYRRGGDSLMGRYFPYRMHPLSTGELLYQEIPVHPIRPPRPMVAGDWQKLLQHGGFPEPFQKGDARFTRRWRELRRERLFKEDLRDLTRVHELGLLEILGRLLAERSGEQIICANIASDLQVAPNTVKSWIATLAATYYGFLVPPWFRNITRALRKESKWFLRDWSGITDPGKRAETFVACHLFKAVECFNDLGFGAFELRYVRDKEKREVDFLVVREGRPWILVEVKSRSDTLSPALGYFQKLLKADHAFQVVLEQDYVDADCFTHSQPVIVPAQTFLSQLP